MKKLLIITAFICTAVFAQAQKLHLGLKIQPNVGYFKSDTNTFVSGGSRAGFGFGLIGDYMFGENFGFSTGVLLTTQGFKSETKIAADTLLTTTYKLQYIEVPLTIKLKTNEIGLFKYWGQLGLGTGVNLKARADVIKSKNGTEKPSGSDVNINKVINLFRASLLLAAGVEYEVGGNASLIGGIEYNNGFNDIYTPKNAKFNNSYIGLTVGVIF